MLLKKLNSRRGFTLVEVIITVMLIAIVSAILIPSFSGYTDRAKAKAVRSAGMEIYTAAQAALDEVYTFHSEEIAEYVNNNGSVLYQKNGSGKYDVYGTGIEGSNAGMFAEISYKTLSRIQNASDADPEDVAVCESVNGYIAAGVLEFLESGKDSEEIRYPFPKTNSTKRFGNHNDRTDSGYNTLGSYLESTKTECVCNIYYDKNGVVFLVEYGCDGFLCTINRSGVVCEKNGTPYWST